MPSNFLMPGGMDSISSILDSPEMRNRRFFDALGGLAQGLIASSGPSPYPRGFGETFGAGMQGALGAVNEDKYLKRAMLNSQLQKNQSDIKRDQEWSSLFDDTAAPSPAAAPAAAPSGGNDQMAAYRAAIAGNESGGNYQAVGPDTGKGRAYGKYQVMDFNVGPWTQEALGQAMAPEQFLASPEAQDAVFDAKFGAYVQKYGSEGAARAWFAGEGGMNDPGRKDVLGTTVAGYGDRFSAALPQVAQAGGQPIPQGGGGVAPTQAPPQQAAVAPRTMREVIATIPPAARKIIAAAGRKQGLPLLMKYADPETVPAIDVQTSEVVFAPKHMLNSGRYQPIDAQKLANESRRIDMDERRLRGEEANRAVTIGPDGQPRVNQTVVDTKKAISSAQGTDPSSKITVEIAQDAIKRNSEIQKSALVAQSSITRLGVLQNLLDQINTGRFKGTTTQIKAAAKGAGLNLEALGITDDVAPAQAASALTSLIALENRRDLPGQMSNADRDFLVNAAPAITKDPRGNKILIEVLRGDMRRQVDIAKAAREYIASDAFKTNPAGLDDYINAKVGDKTYYDPKVLEGAGKGAGTVPPPPAGFKIVTPGGAVDQATPSIPPPPPGFRIVQ